MPRLVKKIGYTLYRIWFYILVALPIFLFFPFLLLTTLSQKWYPYFFWLARNLWALPILYGMGCPPKVYWDERLERGKSYMLVANHTSMLDIMLMLYISKNPFVFVGKKELAKIPVFGFFYKRVCIMVDRGDARSRTAVYRRAQKRLNQGLSICIFPEGGVPDDESVLLDNFKDGAFKMAIAHTIPVVPMTFYDNKKRFSFSFFSGGPGRIRAKVHSFYKTENLSEDDKAGLREKVRTVILKELQTR
ncbi:MULTISPECIES: lysophospholipid acyltransferase family protein [Zobellia]|uniref:1-acyl-sn-glycerol-3-phosphate acyltransferase n=1 Tax=Zobellia galactanivorans (strain DSM 12802 / CCUG 47099 / CIP 106680 / NCIMB 13871 / Dsij) TaxID=63186 RepID=G0L4Y9_ZOBGA|nr:MULTISPECIES: lysophospholipid acyltransferase family protein [Zobellia]MBU3026643.1 1-acyl-sn-glycerol-3-phosphate acyltransferase [Zobellia galactanivorans]OWW26865.1 1-acyl-sn-glycerol-3-phosphate acyltransferase [Zobellia sp. OII3]CAZ95847.1 Acyltransferase [Zobellia galactanivorans]